MSDVVKTKTYTVKVHTYEDGTESMNRENDGFNPLELLGICEIISGDVREHMKGIIKAKSVTRTVIERITKY